MMPSVKKTKCNGTTVAINDSIISLPRWIGWIHQIRTFQQSFVEFAWEECPSFSVEERMGLPSYLLFVSLFVLAFSEVDKDCINKLPPLLQQSPRTFCGSDGETWESRRSPQILFNCGLYVLYPGPCGCPSYCSNSTGQGTCVNGGCICKPGWRGRKKNLLSFFSYFFFFFSFPFSTFSLMLLFFNFIILISFFIFHKRSFILGSEKNSFF